VLWPNICRRSIASFLVHDRLQHATTTVEVLKRCGDNYPRERDEAGASLKQFSARRAAAGVTLTTRRMIPADRSTAIARFKDGRWQLFGALKAELAHRA